MNDKFETDNNDTFNVWILEFIILQLTNETLEPDNIEIFKFKILTFIILQLINEILESDNIEIFNVWIEPVKILIFNNDKLKTSKLTILALLIDALFVIEVFLYGQLYIQIVHGSIVSFTKMHFHNKCIQKKHYYTKY